MAASVDRDAPALSIKWADANIEQTPAPHPKVAGEPNKTQFEPSVPGLLPVCGVAIITGPTGIGASLLAVDLAVAVANGQPWLGLPTVRKPVVFNALRDSVLAGMRLQSCCSARGVPVPGGVRSLSLGFNAVAGDHRLPVARMCPPGAVLVLDHVSDAAPMVSLRDAGVAVPVGRGLRLLAESFRGLVVACVPDGMAHPGLAAQADVRVGIERAASGQEGLRIVRLGDTGTKAFRIVEGRFGAAIEHCEVA